MSFVTNKYPSFLLRRYVEATNTSQLTTGRVTLRHTPWATTLSRKGDHGHDILTDTTDKFSCSFNPSASRNLSSWGATEQLGVQELDGARQSEWSIFNGTAQLNSADKARKRSHEAVRERRLSRISNMRAQLRAIFNNAMLKKWDNWKNASTTDNHP